MQNFSFLGGVQVVFPLLFQADGGWPVGENKNKAKPQPARLSLGLAELGKNQKQERT